MGTKIKLLENVEIKVNEAAGDAYKDDEFDFEEFEKLVKHFSNELKFKILHVTALETKAKTPEQSLAFSKVVTATDKPI